MDVISPSVWTDSHLCWVLFRGADLRNWSNASMHSRRAIPGACSRTPVPSGTAFSTATRARNSSAARNSKSQSSVAMSAAADLRRESGSALHRQVGEPAALMRLVASAAVGGGAWTSRCSTGRWVGGLDANCLHAARIKPRCAGTEDRAGSVIFIGSPNRGPFVRGQPGDALRVSGFRLAGCCQQLLS